MKTIEVAEALYVFSNNGKIDDTISKSGKQRKKSKNRGNSLLTFFKE